MQGSFSFRDLNGPDRVAYVGNILAICASALLSFSALLRLTHAGHLGQTNFQPGGFNGNAPSSRGTARDFFSS